LRRGEEVVDIVPEWREIANTAVRLFGVIPDQVIHHFPVKGIDFIEVIDVPVDKLFLNSFIEPLKAAVRLRVFGIVEEMHQAVFLTCFIEVFFKLTTVVCLDSGSVEWSDLNELPEEIAAIG